MHSYRAYLARVHATTRLQQIGQARESDGDEDSSQFIEDSDARGSATRLFPALPFQAMTVITVREPQSAVVKKEAVSATVNDVRESGSRTSADEATYVAVSVAGEEGKIRCVQGRTMREEAVVESDEDKAQREEEEEEERHRREKEERCRREAAQVQAHKIEEEEEKRLVAEEAEEWRLMAAAEEERRRSEECESKIIVALEKRRRKEEEERWKAIELEEQEMIEAEKRKEAEEWKMAKDRKRREDDKRQKEEEERRQAIQFERRKMVEAEDRKEEDQRRGEQDRKRQGDDTRKREAQAVKEREAREVQARIDESREREARKETLRYKNDVEEEMQHKASEGLEDLKVRADLLREGLIDGKGVASSTMGAYPVVASGDAGASSRAQQGWQELLAASLVSSIMPSSGTGEEAARSPAAGPGDENGVRRGARPGEKHIGISADGQVLRVQAQLLG